AGGRQGRAPGWRGRGRNHRHHRQLPHRFGEPTPRCHRGPDLGRKHGRGGRLLEAIRRSEVSRQGPGLSRVRAPAPRDGQHGRGLQERHRQALALRSPMVEKIIEFCARNRLLVLIAVGFALVASIGAIRRMKLDAIPDLSDPQVIVFTEWMGRSPTLVEDQVTYPITSKLIGTPHVTDVRGFSMFGMSFVYVIFEEGTDIYWARSRVLEYMNGLRGSLPEGATPTLWPDATGIGWVFQYALVDK